MCNRFLSLQERTFFAAFDCNNTRTAPDWVSHWLLYYLTPKTPNRFTAFPKQLKIAVDEKEETTLKRICVKFCCSVYHGQQIMYLLKQQGFNMEGY